MKQKTTTMLLSLVLVLTVFSTKAQNTFPATGNVGIGTVSPAALLDVNEDALINGLRVGRGTGNDPLNTCVGEGALSGIVGDWIGVYNTAFGLQALGANTSGEENTAVGIHALSQNTNGTYNTAVGSDAMRSINSSYNTAIGCNALSSSNGNTAFGNTAVGSFAMLFNTGNNSAAVGSYALSVSTGTENCVLGANALSRTAGSRNIAIGSGSMQGYSEFDPWSNGSRNVAIGTSALSFYTTGSENTTIGYNSMRYNTTGSGNAVIGNWALSSNESGSYNVVIGDSAGLQARGSANIFVGRMAGYNETSDNKLYIGNDSSKAILYGDLATGQLLIGHDNPTGYTFKGSRKLNVLGGILADSVRVALSTEWADYVFNTDYQLKPLGELETFIKTNKHLPGMPTANDVAANGIELGNMNVKLLEKVEELTLYILQQQKEIELLKERINKVEGE